MLNQTESKNLRNMICGEVNPHNKDDDMKLEEFIDAMPVRMNRIFRAYLRNQDIAYIAKAYEIPEKMANAIVLRAIRKMRAPMPFWIAVKGYGGWLQYKERSLKNHSAVKVATDKGHLSTKTKNILIKNGLETYKMVMEYCDAYPDALATIPGLGKIGMAEVYQYLCN